MRLFHLYDWLPSAFGHAEKSRMFQEFIVLQKARKGKKLES